MLAAGQVAGLSAVGRNVQTKYEDWVDEHLGGEYEQVDLDAEQGFTRQLGAVKAGQIVAWSFTTPVKLKFFVRSSGHCESEAEQLQRFCDASAEYPPGKRHCGRVHLLEDAEVEVVFKMPSETTASQSAAASALQLKSAVLDRSQQLPFPEISFVPG
mmetsp:Transcript_5170/g.18932  ORF Transcript_5170/g.18932 Transcript_5170/m.18932 type:complete len:157 (-) Transcript_5170:64-534(-)